MSYTVQQLATLSGVSVRTLHYYDEIGLLKPANVTSNGYRHYEDAELLKLQQIMFFKEMDFSLPDIKKILNNPQLDITSLLKDQRELIIIQRKRLNVLLRTINNTIKKINKEKNMKDHELYEGFTKEKAEAYAQEAKERWGNTDAYKQSAGKYEKLTLEQKMKMKDDGENLMKRIAAVIEKGPESEEAQKLIDEHFNSLRFFYEPTTTLYRNLGIMYVGDERFGEYFDRFHKNLRVFMRDAMAIYCDRKEAEQK